MGGKTFSPAAFTGAHVAGEKLPVSTMPTVAFCCLPGASVTVANLELTRDAALPICLPLLVTAETPGYPRGVQLVLPVLTNLSG